MNTDDLEFIYKAVCKAYGFNISTKKRGNIHVCARAVFYYYALKYTIHKKDIIGKYVGRDHCAVINTQNKLSQYMDMKDFKVDKFSEVFAKKFKDNKTLERLKRSRNKGLILLKYEAENKKLKSRIETLENRQLRGLNKVIKKELSNIPDEAIEELIETRIKPFAKMYHSRKLNYRTKAS